MSLFTKVIVSFFVSASIWATALGSTFSNDDKLICEKYRLSKDSFGKYGLIDLKGNQILNYEYQEIRINCNCSDLIFAKKNKGYRVFSSAGNRILNFEIQDFAPSNFEEIGSNGSFYKFMKTDGNFIELLISDIGLYKFINKPRGHNSVRVEQTYDVSKGLSLWSYKIKKHKFDSQPIYKHICFSVSCIKDFSSEIDVEKLKNYFFKGVAILPDGTVHLYKHDGTFFEFNQ